MKKVGFIMIGMLLLLTACKNHEEDMYKEFPMSLEVGEFQGVNQDGETVTDTNVKGDVWLATFIFTSCDTVCLPMTATMAKLQQRLKAENLEVKLVSFSIDPDHDQPDVLKEYAERFEADFSNWDFLTGYSQEDIESFVNVSFLSPAAKIEGSNQFMHSTAIYLVGANGVVLKSYEGVGDTPFDEIVKDTKKLK
ncbi:SCO family protein [Bacillus timonensis]|nr:SCO family protein [Bacillus timonensis]